MDARGRDATNPWAMPLATWKSVAKRTWSESNDDNIGLIAAGVAFYAFLALVPLLGAVVLLYGLVADRSTVSENMIALMAVMPTDVATLIGEQLMSVVETSDGKKGFGLILALALALFGARNGAGAVITALNIAYEETEKRSFVAVNILGIGITLIAVLGVIAALFAAASAGYFFALFPATPTVVAVLSKATVYVLLTAAGAGVAASLYRYGPSRRRARWVWISPGSAFVSMTWLAATIGFGFYASNFAGYGATYGSLSAIIVTLTWLYLASYVLLLGAELNAEFEHQTARDTTHAAAPLGQRGAWVADHVAEVGSSRKASSLDAKISQPVSSPKADQNDATIHSLDDAAPGASVIDHLLEPARLEWAAPVSALVAVDLIRRGQRLQGGGLLFATGLMAWFTLTLPGSTRSSASPRR